MGHKRGCSDRYNSRLFEMINRNSMSAALIHLYLATLRQKCDIQIHSLRFE